MKLIVKILNGEEMSLDVLEAQTILSVKQQIANERGIEVAQQRLLISGKPMSDGKCLCDYKVIDGSKVHLVVKPKQGKTPAPSLTLQRQQKREHFWMMLARVLRKHFSEDDYNKLMKQFEMDYHGYIDNLSLDDIERLADSLQNQRQVKST